METQEAVPAPPTESAEKPVVERRLTPQEKAALGGWIPLDTEKMDRYTPAFFKENFPAPEWPVFEILKPRPSDRLRIMERNPELIQAQQKAVAEGKNPDVDPVKMAKEVYRTVRERLSGFSNYRTFRGQQIAFEKGDDGKISDACLDNLGESLIMDLYFRYMSLFNLTPRELEGLG